MEKVRKTFREKVLEIGYQYFSSRTLSAAINLDIFNLIGERRKSPRELAQTTGSNERGLVLLLNALVGMGLLDKKGDLYFNTPYGKEILLKGKKYYIGDFLRFHNTLTEGWNRLEESLRTGAPIREPNKFQKDPAETRTFILAMHNTAMGHCEKLAKQLDLKGAKTLIDIGGGSGAFSIFFCKANPGLKATILDLPATLEITREIISSFGMQDRITLLEGDYNSPLPKGFDAAFLSHIIHGEGEEENRALMRNVFQALNPRGKIIIQDFILKEDMATPTFASTFALFMLLFTEKGRTYSFGEIKGWLQEAGFRVVLWKRPPLPRDISLVVAKKP